MWEVQKALVAALKADTDFMSSINNRIYDEPPTNQKYPYVLVGDMTEIPDNRHTFLGFNITSTFTIWTKPGGLGFSQAKEITRKMNTVLNMKIFPLGGSFSMIICFLEDVTTAREDQYRVIRVIYRVFVH